MTSDIAFFKQSIHTAQYGLPYKLAIQLFFQSFFRRRKWLTYLNKFILGISRDKWHKRRSTGGRMNQIRKKRKFELGRPPSNTKVMLLLMKRAIYCIFCLSCFRAFFLDFEKLFHRECYIYIYSYVLLVLDCNYKIWNEIAMMKLLGHLLMFHEKNFSVTTN